MGGVCWFYNLRAQGRALLPSACMVTWIEGAHLYVKPTPCVAFLFFASFFSLYLTIASCILGQNQQILQLSKLRLLQVLLYY